MSQKAVIFSAPSGSGKTTIVKRQLENFPQLTFSISVTTRPPRESEVDGKDYYFLSIEEFKRISGRNGFVEEEEVYPGAYYGTLRSEVERIWSEGKAVVFDVDVQGGTNLKNYFGDKALSIFVRPPSLEVLKTRLEARGTETVDSLEKRLGKAEHELTFEPHFDSIVINNDLDRAVSEVSDLVNSFLEN